MYRTKPQEPPHPLLVTPELRRARERWYASNPWRPDWNAAARAQRGAHLAMIEADRERPRMLRSGVMGAANMAVVALVARALFARVRAELDTLSSPSEAV